MTIRFPNDNRKAELDALLGRIKSGEQRVDAATANKVASLVCDDAFVTTGEATQLEGVKEYLKVLGERLARGEASEAGTIVGVELLGTFASIATSRFNIHADYVAKNAFEVGLKNFFAGFWSLPSPDYIGVREGIYGGKDERVDASARQLATHFLIGPDAYERLLKEYPKAIEYHDTDDRPTAKADVAAVYQYLRAEVNAGRWQDENDPLAPVRNILNERYR